MKKKHVGSSLDSWLQKEGICEEVTGAAIKRVLARKVQAATKQQTSSKADR